MVVVVTLIGLLAGISFPSVSSGLDSIRLRSACDSLAGFLNGALNRAQRRQQVIEVIIEPRENKLWLYSTEPGYQRTLEMPDGVRIEEVLPALPEEPGAARRILLLPGGATPRIAVQLVNRRGSRRIVRVDPITGVPRVETPERP
jgi:type II secretory pathway pseudopilin PulG